MSKLLELPLSVVEENPQALRTTVNKDSLAYAQLKDGIRATNGLLNPISVREYTKDDGSTGYRLVDGLHRLTAYGELGYDTIPVNIVTIEDSKLLVAQIIGNNHIKTSKTQYAQGLKQLIQHNGMTVKEVAAMVCRPEKWVNDQLGLLDLPEQIQKYVDEGTINAANALSLRKLPKDRILDYLQAAMTESPEVFSPKIEEAVKELRSAAKTGVKAGPPEFKAVAKPRKPSAFKQAIEEFNRTGTIADLRSMIDVQGISNPFDAVVATLQWALHLDPISVEAERAKWNAEQAVKEEAKRQREEEKAAKKQADAAKEIQNAVNSELAA